VIGEESAGIEAVQTGDYQVILLDEKLPEFDGLDVCRQLRRKGVTIPILMVSESTQKVILIRCLELGADDFLVQPFNLNELIARIRALVRRDHKDFASLWAEKCGIRLDMATHTVHGQNTVIELTKKEALLLKRLMIEAPDTISRDTLLQDVWGIDNAHTSNRLDVYVRRLRWKLEQLCQTNLIHTVRGNGYYLSDEASGFDNEYGEHAKDQALAQKTRLY
jgi:DNA-binding response OmpR family regulator